LIADMASQAAKKGFITFIWFIGMLSVNLAVINFLPVPPLDGGHMAFLIAEKLRGKPLPEKAMNLGMMTGLVLVLGLMLFVLTQDVIRYLFTAG
jgi:regulator of sigma E protease